MNKSKARAREKHKVKAQRQREVRLRLWKRQFLRPRFIGPDILDELIGRPSGFR